MTENSGSEIMGEQAEQLTTSTRDADQLVPRLQEWLSRQVGTQATVTALTKPDGNGLSSETLVSTVRWTEGSETIERRVVVRLAPPSDAYPVFPGYDLAGQARIMRLVGNSTRVAVPEILWDESDPSVLGSPFFVMSAIDGLVPPDVMPYTFGDNWLFDCTEGDRRSLQESAVNAVCGIHSIQPADHDLEFLDHGMPGATSLERDLEYWQRYHDWVVESAPSPLLGLCFDWLRDHFPSEVGPDCLSWGDSRIGNMIFSGNRVVAVIDWEMATVVPPEVDLGWLCYFHLFFQDLAVGAGLPGLPEMFKPGDVKASYSAVTDRPLGELKWYIAYAAIRHATITRRIAERAIRFGQATEPEEVDDLILQRATLHRMLDGSYWSSVAL